MSSPFQTSARPIFTRLKQLSSINKRPAVALILGLASATMVNAANADNAPTIPVKTPEDTDHIVSVDGLGLFAPDGGPKIGDGSGDLVVLVYDPSGKSPRKRSLMLDLSTTDSDGSVNDLTANDIRDTRKRFTASHPELDAFIARSKDYRQIVWQAFAIANHTTPNPEDFTQATLDFYGLVTTEAIAPKNAMPTRSIHKSRAYRAALVSSNIEYDLESNGAMVSFTGEPPAFDAELHSTLNNGANPMGSINQPLQIGAHLIELEPATEQNRPYFTARYEKYGRITLNYDADKQEASLDFRLR